LERLDAYSILIIKRMTYTLSVALWMILHDEKREII